MNSFLFLYLFLKLVVNVEPFDPSKINYCSFKCHNGNVSSACKDLCKMANDGREEITENMEGFRQTLLDSQNELRNRVARGDEKDKGYPSAADMNVLNYDLELEHVARCYIMSSRYKDFHDPCRLTSYCRTYAPGQNLHGSSRKNTSLEAVKHGVQMWYDELDNIPKEERESVMKKYRSDQEKWGKTGHFTELIWAEMGRLGCVRVWIPNNPATTWRYTLACNYASNNNAFCAGNVLGKPVYTIGDPCSKCGGQKCNKDTEGGKYDALCGEMKPAPKDKTTKLDKEDGRKGENSSPASVEANNLFLLPLIVVIHSMK